METKEIFALALCLPKPWFVRENSLDIEHARLEIAIAFERGGEFDCSKCGASGCKAYDTAERRWRHMDFFQYKTTLSARVPRADCKRCGKREVAVPWAREGSGFTLLFEALVMAMASQMPVMAMARILDEHDTRLWRAIHYHVDDARSRRDDRGVRHAGIDETSIRRGHEYVSIFVDVDAPRVLFATEGKDASTVERFKKDLIAHGGSPDNIQEVCADMSPAFIKGIAEFLPAAEVTFDKFHVVKIINEAVDKTRKSERTEYPELKGHRYALLKNPETMTDAQLAFTSELLLRKTAMKTARAFHLRLVFQELYYQPASAAETFLEKWCRWASRSRIPAMVEATRTIRRHWDGVLRWFQSRLTNGLLEGINSLVQSAKSRARGYRTTRNFVTMIYLIAGKLEFNVTHLR